MPVFDFFPFHHQTGYFSEADFCAAPVDLEMKRGIGYSCAMMFVLCA